MIYLPAHESGHLDCNIPRLSTAAYALATYISQYFTYPELYLIATFIITVGQNIFMNSKEVEGCKPIGYGLER